MKITEKEEKLYKEVFDEYVKKLKMPSEEELGMVEFSYEFEEKMEALLKNEKPLRVVTPKKVLMKIASVFIVCSLLASVCVVGIFANPNVDETTIKDIIELQNSFMYETEKERDSYYIPHYLPNGYSEAGGGGISSQIRYVFADKYGDRIIFIQYMEGIPLPEIDLMADEYEEINGGLYINNSHTGLKRFIWSTKGYIFEIRAEFCSKEDVLKMAEKLKRN